MEKEQFEAQLMSYLAGILSEEERGDFESFLESNLEYQSEFQELKDVWQMVNEIETPQPSQHMDHVFFEMLSGELEKQKKKIESKRSWKNFWSIQKPQLAFGVVLLGIGLAVGYYMNMETKPQITETVIANEETESVRQKLVLTLLDQPSVNQRLQGVSEANKFKDADQIVIQALLQTLNNDSNVNVRLAAIESLTNYVDNPIVRQGLVKSIPNQESPILQITLANLMVALQEKASVEPFKELLKEKKLDTTVKKKLQNSIESII